MKTIFKSQWLTLVDRNNFYVVKRPPFVTIIAVQTNNILCIKQQRPTKPTDQWSLPMGFINKKENALKAAKRELAEETNYTASNWKELGAITPASAFIETRGYIYFATDLAKKNPQQTDVEEKITKVAWVPWEKAAKLTSDAVSLAAIARWRALCEGTDHQTPA